MAIHIVGIKGLIGSTIAQYSGSYDLGAMYGYSSPQISLDVNNEDTFAALRLSPGDCIINCVGYTAVDAAESDQERCFQFNAYGPAALASYALENECKFISLSTDYVFSPQLSADELSQMRPWRPNDPISTQCVYGASKSLGERLIFEQNPQALIVRTSWVYDTVRTEQLSSGRDFLSMVAMKALAKEAISMVDDQIGSPTWVYDIAQALIFLAQSTLSGEILHYAGAGQCSRYEYAQEIYRQLDAPPSLVHAVTSQELQRPAKRPQYSVLSVTEWNNYQIYPTQLWKTALAQALAPING